MTKPGPKRGFKQSRETVAKRTGIKQTLQHIEKRVAARRGKPSWAKGKKFTKQHRARISAALRGKRSPLKGVRQSKELIERRIAPQRGKRRSVKPKTKQHLSRIRASLLRYHKRRGRKRPEILQCIACGKDIPWRGEKPNQYAKRKLCDNPDCSAKHRSTIAKRRRRSYLSYEDFCTVLQSSDLPVPLGAISGYHRWWKQNHVEGDGLPSNPVSVYADQWQGWPAALQRNFVSLAEFRIAIQRLGIKSRAEYQRWWRSTANKLYHPDRMPAKPERIYQVLWRELLPATWHGKGRKQTDDHVASRFEVLRRESPARIVRLGTLLHNIDGEACYDYSELADGWITCRLHRIRIRFRKSHIARFGGGGCPKCGKLNKGLRAGESVFPLLDGDAGDQVMEIGIRMALRKVLS